MRKIFFTVILAGLVSLSYAQSFMNGVGIHLMGNTNTIGGTDDFGFGVGIIYSPRFNFLETEKLSVSAGIPLTLGIAISASQTVDQYGSNYDNTSVGLTINAPLIINLNMGRGSTKANKEKIGYFVGAGFAFQYGIYVSDIYDPNRSDLLEDYSSSNYGPAANAGVRFGVGRKHRNIELRLSYMAGLKKTDVISGFNSKRPSYFGVACLFNF